MNTNNTFTLTMPTDDPIALNAFSRALHEMAVAHGAPVVQATEPVPAEEERTALEITPEDVDKFRQAMTDVLTPFLGPKYAHSAVYGPEMTDDEKLAIKEAFDNSSKTYVSEDDANEAFERYAKVVEEDLTSVSHTDSEGLPWDERIHAGSKTRNQDGTWKARKKRQDMTAEEWSDYVTSVKAELKELMNVPVVTPPVVSTPEQEVSDHVKSIIAFYDDDESPVPPVVNMPVPPVPVVEPEVTVAIEAEQLPPVPPVVDVPPAPPVSDSVTTFPALMTWLTSHESVLTVERVNQVVQSHGLTELKQLIQRPDLIPQVFVTLSQEV
ncbi:MAG: hypothetical protein ACRC7Q_06225 [Plesiomonas shigelloides]